MWESRKQLFWCLFTAIVAVLTLNLCSCSTVKRKPAYGPHTSTTLTNHEWDIERRNIYSDGWQDHGAAKRAAE